MLGTARKTPDSKLDSAAPASAPAWAQSEPMRALCKLAPRWAEIKTKMLELSERKEALYAELRPLIEMLSRRGEFNSLRVAERAMTQALAAGAPPAKEIKASPRAAALLGPLAPAPRAPEPPYTPVRGPDRDRFDEIVSEIVVIDEALALLAAPMPGKRRSEVEDMYLAGCEKYCEAMRPEFDAIVARFCAAVVELGKAKAEYDDFTKDKLRGIAWTSLRPIDPLPLVGDPTDPSSALRLALTLAAEHGHFDLASLPTNWKGRKPSVYSISSRP